MRMQHNGDLDEEADGTNLVPELYDMEQEDAQESCMDSEANIVTMESQTMYNADDKTKRIMLYNMEYMDTVEFGILRDDLVQLNYASDQ